MQDIRALFCALAAPVKDGLLAGAFAKLSGDLAAGLADKAGADLKWVFAAGVVGLIGGGICGYKLVRGGQRGTETRATPVRSQFAARNVN